MAVAEGEYVIKVGDADLFFHTWGGTLEGGKIVLHGDEAYAKKEPNGKFLLVKGPKEGTYAISATDGDFCLHATGGSTDGAEIVLHGNLEYAKKNGNSLFELVPASEKDHYYIKVSDAELCLHAWGGSTDSAALKLHGDVEYAKKAPNSVFKLVPTKVVVPDKKEDDEKKPDEKKPDEKKPDEKKPEPEKKDPPAEVPATIKGLVGKDVQIKNATHNTYLGSSDKRAVQMADKPKSWETWELKPVDGSKNLFFIHSHKHKMNLGSTAEGHVDTVKKSDTWQQWSFEPAQDGTHYVISKTHGRHLGATPDGKVDTTDKKASWQRWHIQPTK